MEAMSLIPANSTVPTATQDLQVLPRIAMFPMGFDVHVRSEVVNRLTSDELWQMAGAVAGFGRTNVFRIEPCPDAKTLSRLINPLPPKSACPVNRHKVRI